MMMESAIIQAVRHALLQHYDTEGPVDQLPGYDDLNFEIKTARLHGVLKVMHPGCDPELVEMQAAAMEHARRAGLTDQIPAVIHTKTEELHTTIVDPDGKPRIAWLVSFLPGKLMASVELYTPTLAASIGELLGRLDRALQGYEHPLLERELKWDLQQAEWIGDHLDVIADQGRRERVERIIARFATELKPLLTKLPASVLHNDANDMNLFVDRDGESLRATGIIDFGDMISGPRAIEPAVAMAYAMMGPGDPLQRGAALAAAYHHAFPLESDDLDLLAPLVRTRLAVTIASAAIQRSANSANQYLTVSETPAWDLLDYLDGIGDDQFTTTIRAACEQPASVTPATTMPSLLVRRRRVSLANQSLFYDQPLHLVRGERHFLYDASGTEYLDAYNNVPHVGHGHPHVVEAVRRQMATLNTNTRYLQDVHLDYAERLLALLPPTLTKIVFVNSGSEANELALRLARAATGARDMLVMDHCYHGNTTGAMDISPYKFMHPKGTGVAPDWVHVVPQPDSYRGSYRGSDSGQQYIAAFGDVLDGVVQSGRQLAGFISECLPSVGGQIVLPPGYLNAVYAKVRAAGGICIADDVQTSLGRLGQWFWGFEQQGAVPDVAVWGKPLGNGFPLAAVAMTAEIADAFGQEPEFFATFGGSSAACAAGAAVLDVLDDEELPARACRVGAALLDGLHKLAEHHELIGDIRGYGLFLGVELVRDRGSREPATPAASRIVNLMRTKQVLLGLEGPDNNVLKIRPPMTFDLAAAERLLARFDEVLGGVEEVR